MYKFFLKWKNNNSKIIFLVLYFNDLCIKQKSFKHFYVSISIFLCTFALPNLSKNEENISTITQKKSK